MLSMGEVELTCDMAEIYHIYITDWYSPPFPVSFLADLACGLDDDSRIKRKIGNIKLTLSQSLQALIVDKLSVLIWQNTEDGHKGRNYPESLYKALTEEKKDELKVFDSIEDFDEWYKETHHE